MIYRRPSAAIMENGETLVVSTEFLTNTEAPYKLKAVYDNVKTNEFQFFLQNPNQEHYPAGTRVLQLTSTCERDASRLNTPVLVLANPGGSRGASPVHVMYLEAGTDPEFLYDPRTGVCHVFYWANCWSPEQATQSTGIGDQLFPGVDPPRMGQGGPWSPPPPPPPGPPTSTDSLSIRVKDLPPLGGSLGSPPSPPGSPPVPPERVGNFLISNFWVAPWTEAFLYRHNPDLITLPLLNLPPSPPASPPGSPLTLYPGLDWVIPQTPEIKEVIQALAKRDAGEELTNKEKSVLECYDKAPQRLADLARTTRVLFHAVGKLCKLQRVDQDKAPAECHVYLVLEHPQAVMAFPRGINKVMYSRLKWSSFVGGLKVFVTAELGFMYPSPVSCQTLNSIPQVDFTVFCPHHGFDSLGRAGTLPETKIAQKPPFIPASTMIFPTGFPGSLVAAIGATMGST